MKFGWIEMLLVMLATVVVTLVGVWAWEEFKAWRVNREYGPNNRRAKAVGRRRGD
jgi:cytoskeletal protein RodZ